MLNQIHIAGQHGQLGGAPHPNKGLGALRKAWHSENDVNNVRREILSQIAKLLQKTGWENKMPGIVNELELFLYVSAASKEEYGDSSTLEHRIHSLIMRGRNGHKSAQLVTQSGPAASRVFSPGFSNITAPTSSGGYNYSTLGTGNFQSPNSRMLLNTSNATTSTTSAYDVDSIGPTAGFNMYAHGSAIGQGASSFGVCESGFERNGQYLHGVGIPRTGSCMIPTPGMNVRTSEVPYNSTGLGCANTNDGSIEKLKQHLLLTGTRGDDLFGVTRGNGFVMNAPDVVDTRGLYNTMLQAGPVSSNENLNSLVASQASLIHGTLSEQQDFQHANNLQSHQMLLCNDSTQRSLLFQQQQQQQQQHQHQQQQQNQHQQQQQNQHQRQQHQQQQQPGRSLLISNRCDKTASDTFILHTHTEMPERVFKDHGNSEMLINERDQPQSDRSQSAFVGQGIQEGSCLERDARMDSERQFNSQKLQECSQQGTSVNQNMDSHSGQACQANSADTGQSEVVSNDDSLAPSQVKEVGSSNFLQQVKRQRWLLIFLRHVSRCTNPGSCTVSHCEAGQDAWNHLKSCQTYRCSYPRCKPLKELLQHHQYCRNSKCVICSPVRLYFANQSVVNRTKLGRQCNSLPSRSKTLQVGSSKESVSNEVESPPVKRVKMEAPVSDVSQGSQIGQQSISTVESQEQVSDQDTLSTPKDAYSHLNASQTAEHQIPFESMSDKGKDKSTLSKTDSPSESSLLSEVKVEGQTNERTGNSTKSETGIVNDDSATKVAGIADLQISPSSDPLKQTLSNGKPAKTKVSGISYIESLTPQQIRQHISSLRKWIGQSKNKAERNQAMEHQMSASACSACAVENLSFDPIPVFCTQCGCRIKRNATYHTAGSGENTVNFCGPCYNAIRTDVLETDGLKIQKSMLGKKKNDEQRVEAWVECDKCKKWQHQICVLFNARINKERSEYICPECCIAEMERGQRVPWPANLVAGAKDLPKTVLSNHVEDRLARRLKEERNERARALGKDLDEVPTADGLVVRVISSVDKKLEVRSKFLELFQQEDYPKEFLYKSKMLMLFQKIEGVEVCLFGMYVQEFGSDCPQPNRRHVYLSYLDSVKYFRPDVKTTSGEALRTFVYHEILIAYLDYCKNRGFSSCYIWACPPLKGDDYILYCHPEIQKTPKTDKLREWYLSMISKAKREDIVVANRNLYDYFFTSAGESKAKITAANLPYFDGDYWPGAAEDILQQLQQDDGGMSTQRRGRVKLATKRTTKTSTHAEPAGSGSKDLQLMQKLGQSIAAMKEDFMMVHLHHACSYCHNFIISGYRWYCQQCAGNFQLCSGCYEEHQQLGDEDKHPAGKKERHLLIMEEVGNVPANTSDRDEIMESELFDNRHAFLNLCQGNQYQYDTLRRAKHSSMMVLYHLHNPDAPAFIVSCSICHNEMEGAHGWKCKVCSDYDVCSSCYSSKEVQQHPHKLVARCTAADDNAKLRMQQLRVMLEVLAHASKCREACQYPKCRNMKELFRHGNTCTKRAAGGCSRCKRMWILLQCHARSCKETTCTVPRCMDLKKHFRRLQLQQESRRRAAVQEMIRQRAAEQSAGSQ